MFLKRAVQEIPLQIVLVALSGLLAFLRLWVFADAGPSVSGAFPEAYAHHPAVFAMLSLLLLLSSSAFLLRMAQHAYLVEHRKFYPAMLLPLFLSLFVRASDWFPLAVLALLCLCLYPLLFAFYSKGYRQNNGLVFGLLCALASMMYLPMALLLLFYYVMLLAHRMVNWRSLLLPVTGAGVFWLYAWLFFLCFPGTGEVCADYLSRQWQHLGFHMPQLSWRVFLPLAACLLLYVVSTYRMIRFLYVKNIAIRRKSLLLFYLSLYFLLLFLLTPLENPVPLCGFLSVLALILCEEEAFLKRRFFYNALFLCCWALNVIFLFFPSC
ncbi:MAG: hypothetical protein J5873_01415 [Bacteroidales bacterium]|nr:hypothetical protein [Bacteroidales bacterium]